MPPLINALTEAVEVVAEVGAEVAAEVGAGVAAEVGTEAVAEETVEAGEVTATAIAVANKQINSKYHCIL